MPDAFIHFQHAHCESGVTTNLLRHRGMDISEPMAFGIGAGLFFAHLPFVKVSGTPGTTFRIWPGAVFKRAAQRLGVTVESHRFRKPAAAMAALDKALAAGIPVGLLTSVYYLPYLPEAYRFHFNAHNIVVFGKEGEEYLVSDPVLETTTRIHQSDLAKARFAKGTPEPRGGMYFIKGMPERSDLAGAIKAGIKQTCWYMLSPPMPWFGNKAITLLSKRIRRYPDTLTPRKATLYLGSIIRMQEEIGTGGGGFRYLYAAFLQEAGRKLDHDGLLRHSEELTSIGDAWRAFAYGAARIVKSRTTDAPSYGEIADQLRDIGSRERAFFRSLQNLRF